ncbi:MAG TPA: alcohol dehydrogenase catalytic domain-containing protein [Candidatus Dormibacteraeota bacterium]|nr:alcohol dehydrogenase catalytic domain-containing protein [Candidatus Dormibacteraeota bacterium]
MRALVFDPAPHRLAWAGLASRVRPAWALGPGSLLSLREVPVPKPPGPDWVRLHSLWAGICGSDVKEVLLQAASDNPLSGLVSFPHVPGHEMVAVVEDAGSTSGLQVGDLLAVDPWVGCVARGLDDLCPACAAGFPPHCRRQLEGGPWGSGRGLHLGNIHGLPGGFAEVFHAHPSQCHRLPVLSDPRIGVLADPLAVGLHAVERAGSDPKSPILVLGAGTIGLSLALAARARWPEVPIWVTAAWEHQDQLITSLGAEPLPANAAQVLAEVAGRTGAPLVRPWRGGPWMLGSGVGLVLDSIGSSATTELALRCLAPRGRIVVVGVAKPARTENTLAYYKEAEIIGSNGYGRSSNPGGSSHLLDQALEILHQRGQELNSWCTHGLALGSYRQAFRLAANPGRSAAIKVCLRMEDDARN